MKRVVIFLAAILCVGLASCSKGPKPGEGEKKNLPPAQPGKSDAPPGAH